MLEFISPTALDARIHITDSTVHLAGFSVFLFTLTDKASGGEGGGFVIGVVRNTRVKTPLTSRIRLTLTGRARVT